MRQATQENDVVFVDTIESVTSASGVIKLNLVRTVEPTQEGEEPQIVPAGRLVMPLPGARDRSKGSESARQNRPGRGPWGAGSGVSLLWVGP